MMVTSNVVTQGFIIGPILLTLLISTLTYILMKMLPFYKPHFQKSWGFPKIQMKVKICGLLIHLIYIVLLYYGN